MSDAVPLVSPDMVGQGFEHNGALGLAVPLREQAQTFGMVPAVAPQARAPQPSPASQVAPVPPPPPVRTKRQRLAADGPVDVLKLARARRRWLGQQIKQLRRYEREAEELDRLLGLTPAPVRAIESARHRAG